MSADLFCEVCGPASGSRWPVAHREDLDRTLCEVHYEVERGIRR